MFRTLSEVHVSLQEWDLEVKAFPVSKPLVKKDGANFALKVRGCQRLGR